MFPRRDLLRLGLVSGASLAAARKASAARGLLPDGPPPSPRTTPFVQPLPFPATLIPVAPFATDCVFPPQSDLSRLRFYRIAVEERLIKLHPDLPATQVWGYRDASTPPGSSLVGPGPTFIGRAKEPIVARFENNLPRNHIGFGEPTTTVHLHGGHHEARSDGFPADLPGFPVEIQPGATRDYCYPLLDPGFSTGEADRTDRPSTMWYHDHLLDVPDAIRHPKAVGREITEPAAIVAASRPISMASVCI